MAYEGKPAPGPQPHKVSPRRVPSTQYSISAGLQNCRQPNAIHRLNAKRVSIALAPFLLLCTHRWVREAFRYGDLLGYDRRGGAFGRTPPQRSYHRSVDKRDRSGCPGQRSLFLSRLSLTSVAILVIIVEEQSNKYRSEQSMSITSFSQKRRSPPAQLQGRKRPGF